MNRVESPSRCHTGHLLDSGDRKSVQFAAAFSTGENRPMRSSAALDERIGDLASIESQFQEAFISPDPKKIGRTGWIA